MLDESDWKPNKGWIDKASKFYNRSMKSWWEKNAIEMYSTQWRKICCCRIIY